jgi:threonine dehydratase
MESTDRPPTPLVDAPSIGDVREAARRLEGVAVRTPLVPSDGLSRIAGVAVYLKDEGRQRSGSFKLRGAFNAVASLTADERARGLVTASAGNHGLGVAIASRLLGARASIYVPASAPQVKRDRIAAEGADLRLVDGTYDEAHAEAEREARESGRLFVHAFSDPRVVAGAGTVGLEIIEDLPGVRTLIVPVGGGGLIGGIGTAARALAPGCTVVGVQSSETAAMHASLAAGRLVLPPMGETLCDGLSGETDERNLALAQRVVDRMVLVSEAAVRRAMRWLHAEHGIAVEGSGAVGVAAVLEGALGRMDGPVVVVVSGSNVDAARLERVLSNAGEAGSA